MNQSSIYFLVFIGLPLFSSELSHNCRGARKTYKTNLKTLLVNALEEEVPNDAWINKIKKKKVSIDHALQCAVINGKTRAALRLLDEHGANLSITNKKGQTLLMIALAKGHCNLAKELIDRGIDIKSRDHEGQDALIFALFFNHPTLAHKLLDMGANANKMDKKKQTPLLLASQNNHETIVSRLLDAKARADHQEKQGFTPLMFAAQGGRNKVAQYLLTHPYSAKAKQKKDYALGLAAGGGHAATTQLLLDHGANTNTTLSNGHTPLTLALSRKNPFLSKIHDLTKNSLPQKLLFLEEKATQMLLTADQEQLSKLEEYRQSYLVEETNGDALQKLITSENINKTTRDGFSPLEIATSNYDVDAVRILLKAGASTNQEDSKGALLCAAALFPSKSTLHGLGLLDCFSRLCLSIIDLLVQNGVDIEAQDPDGLTALHLFSRSGLVSLAQRLITHKAVIDSMDKCNSTPLIHAAYKGHADVVRLLCQHGAKINWVDEDGDTPLICASKGGHYSAVEELLRNQDSDGSLNAFSTRGESALMCAIKAKHNDIAKLLLEHGADPYLKNKKGKNALDIAKTQGTRSMVRFLLQEIKKEPTNDEKPLFKKQRQAQTPLPSPASIQKAIKAMPDLSKVPAKPKQSPLSIDPSPVNPQQLQSDPIFELIKAGDITISKNNPIDAFALDQNGSTPLIAAVKQYMKDPTNRRLRLINKLLQNRNIQQSINIQDEKGKTALLHAATATDLSLLLTLLVSGADPLIFDYWDNTPLTMFIRKSNAIARSNCLPQLLQTLENKLSPMDYKSLLNQQNSEGKTALIFAVQKGDSLTTMKLINAGADYTITCDSGYSAREHAQNILTQCQSAEAIDQEKIAIYQKMLTLIPESMIFLPSSPSSLFPKKPLEAIEAQSPEETNLQKELKKGASAHLKHIQVNSDHYSQQLSGGLTPLMLAIKHQTRTHIIKDILLQVSVSHINLAARDGNTALYKEIENGARKKIVSMLLTHGAQVRPQDISLAKNKLEKARLDQDDQKYSELTSIIELLHANQTTNTELAQNLFQAAKEGHLSLMGKAITQGANPDTQDPDGNTPLMISLKEGHWSIARNLIQHTNLDIQNRQGLSALMISASQGNYEQTDQLLSRGANDSLQDAQGKTAYAHALQHNHTPVANRIAINRALSQLKKYGDIQHVLDRHLDKDDTKVTHLIDQNKNRNTKPYRGYMHTKFTSFFPQSWEPYTLFMALKSILNSPKKVSERPADINYQGKVIRNALKIQGIYKGILIDVIISFQMINQQGPIQHEWKLVTAYPLIENEK